MPPSRASASAGSGPPLVSYVLVYRTADGRSRRYTIGRHGSPWTPDTARKEALRLLGEIAKGGDPADAKRETREAMSVGELLDAYWSDAEAGRLLTRRKAAKKPKTLATDRGRIEGHIRPLLGRLPVAKVTRQDIEKFMHAVAEGETARRKPSGRARGVSHVRGGRGTASRTLGLVGAIFTYAERRGLRGDNPVRGVMRFADGRFDRRLSDDEYAALGRALVAAEATVWPHAVAAARFLALTGWRSGEVLELKWSDLDLPRRTAKLADTKTGYSMRPLSQAACDVLRGLSRAGDLVFPATRGDGVMSGFPKLFARIVRLGGLPDDVTPKVLRHSFISLAADLGLSEPTIAALAGHKGQSITRRYVHLADAPLLAAADAVAGATVALLAAAKAGDANAGDDRAWEGRPAVAESASA